MESIHKIIGYTEEQYSFLVFKTMLTWADLYSSGCPRKMQTLLANRQINNWFHYEFSKLITKFRKELEPYKNEKNITCKERCQLFSETTTEILEKYPKALMAECKVKMQHNVKKQNFINN